MQKSFEERMGAEMRFHLQQLTEGYIAQGLAPDEAGRRALREFGAVELAKDEVRDLRSVEWLRQLARDLQFAARLARRSLGFSTAVVATLALAIGAAVGVFGLVYAVLLRPLPYPDAERLVSIDNRRLDNLGGKRDAMHMRQFEEWLKHLSTFESVAAYNLFHEHGTFNLTGRGEPERLTGIHVSAGLFPLLGARAAAGRLFADGEDVPGAAPVVILSHAFLRRRFAADPSIVGEALIINDTPHTVAGVLGPAFQFSGTLVAAPEFDVFLPLVRSKETYRYGMYLGVLGKLRQGVTREQAAEQIAALQKTAFGNSELRDFRQEVRPLSDRVNAAMRGPLWMLFGAVALLVFTGCANLANLFLARAAARNGEVSVRAALGAGRGRLVRQLLTECSLLAGIGTALGLALASLTMYWLSGADWVEMPRRAEIGVHWPVALFAVLASGFTTLLFGLAPALQASRVDVVAGLKEGGRATGNGTRRRLRWALVAAQVGLSFVLLAGSGLLMRSLVKLLEVSPGFMPEQLIAMRVDPGERRDRGPRMSVFFEDILTRVRDIPGVTSAALGVNLPLDRNMRWGYEIRGQSKAEDLSNVGAVRMVSPGYFYTLGIQMHAGRDFDSRDAADAPRVVIVNRTLARQIAAVREPIASTLRIAGRDHEVIAVVNDVKHEGLDRESGAEFYLAQSQSLPFPMVDVVVRSALPAGPVAAAVRSVVWAIDPDQPVGTPYTLKARLNRSLSPRRFFMWMLAAFAVFAMLLAFAGVYGVVSYGVTTRKREIGLRMALGATSSDIMRLFTTESMAAGMLGLALGTVGAITFVRLLGSQLYGITSLDPIAFACAGSIVCASIFVATLFPTRFAGRLDPKRALGAE